MANLTSQRASGYLLSWWKLPESSCKSFVMSEETFLAVEFKSYCQWFLDFALSCSNYERNKIKWITSFISFLTFIFILFLPFCYFLKIVINSWSDASFSKMCLIIKLILYFTFMFFLQNLSCNFCAKSDSRYKEILIVIFSFFDQWDS